jgi:predicted acetyltransferase
VTSTDARTVPADATSAERLKDAGYDYRVVDISDEDAAARFARATERGFLGPEPTLPEIAEMRATWAARRNVGVYPLGADADGLPVGTVNSWVADMAVPGGVVPMWAISMVTVSATHRRRGIARGLLEGELRAAASAGVPMAGLTVTEATIYGRYGFGPAIQAARVAVDTRTAGWAASAVPGRLEYVDKVPLATELGAVHENARHARTGQIPGWNRRWLGLSGITADGAKTDATVRGIRYLDADGRLRGAMSFSLKEQPNSYRNTMTIRHLVAETDEAQRALWGFAVNHDLVDRVEAALRPTDDPILHLVGDQRAVELAVHDHGWLRLLDVPAALRGRRFSGSLDVVLRVTDPYGFADGTWRVRADASGAASVEETTAVADVTLGVAELSTVYAGGVPLSQLAAAGRAHGDSDAVSALSRALHTDPAPFLSIWY